MLLNLMKKNLKDLKCENLVVFTKAIPSKDKKEKSSVKITQADVAKKYAHLISEKTLSGKHLECLTIREAHFQGFRNIIFVGLGEEKKMDHESVRQSLAATFEALRGLKATEAAIDFDGITTSSADTPHYIQAAAEGLKLAAYTFDQLKSKNDKEKAKDSALNIHLVSVHAQDKNSIKAFESAVILSDCVNFARYLGDMPGNLMTPSVLAEEAVNAAKGTSLRVTIWDKARIKKEKMGGLLGVSNGSSQEPRFIIMEYKGAKASDKPLVYVGKGLTFDCGGISIKPSAGMEEMKYDMCGGANVIGTLLAIAKLKLKVNAIGLVPATENMPGPAATKPGDVHFARNGKSFEVNNTDAEGRLILADALCYASEQKPALIVDAATLTGAMVVALGNIHTGYFTRNKELKGKIESAAHASGELVWNMPLVDHHVKDMKGTFADLSNISSGKGAGSATAAAFLEQFVEEGIPWAHFDIAGTGWAAGNRLNYCSKKGASGAILRTFVELAKQN